jgi:uncharacterized membrane protein YgcG
MKTTARLALLLVPLLLTGCATTGMLPSASFYGMRVETIQEEPGSSDLKLKLGLEFKVDNPTGIKLTVPEHSFGLDIDGVQAASTGVRQGFSVGSKKSKVVTYDFTLGLGPNGLGAAVGKEAEFSFTAEADVDVPNAIIDILEDNIPSSDALGIGSDGLSESLQSLQVNEGSGRTNAKLRFGHAGRLKLPKVPKIKAPSSGAQPQVQLVGESATMNLGSLLGELEESGAPLVALLEMLQGAAVDQQLRIPVGELLEAIGVPRELTGAALTALNTFMSMQGESTLPSKGSEVVLPVDLPPMSDLLRAVDPQAAAKIDDFEDAWADFTGGSLGLDGGLAIPTALPSGMRVAAPFQIENQNDFAIQTPSFRLAIVDAAGNPIATVGALPSGQAGQASSGLTTPRSRTVEVAGHAEQPMQLITEVHWDALTGGLLEAAVSGAQPPPMEGMRLVGEVTIDPGYGPITVPLAVPLGPAAAQPADTSGSSNKSTSGGSSSSSGSSSSGKSGSGGSSSGGSSSSGSDSSDKSGKSDEEKKKKKKK